MNKSRKLLSLLWKIGSWKKMFLCGKKSLEKPKLELPREIIEWEILPRLPAKSLPQFMCVCKQWRSLISSCEFTRKNLHYLKNKQSLTHRKVIEIDRLSKTFTTRDCDDLNNHDLTTTRSIPFVNEAQKVNLLASFDGLVFVELPYIFKYAFWNPLTGAYEKLSNSPNIFFTFGAFGFYFDSHKKDYKVLHVACYGAFRAFIYSQRHKSTKEIQWLERPQLVSNSFWSTPISLGESLYFMVKPYKFTNCPQCWIIVFDVKSEKFREIRFPPLNREYAYYDGSLMLIKGCIHICVATYIHIQETGLIMETDGELWRMDGDRDGWTKVKDFPPTHNHPLTFDEMEDLARNLEANNRRNTGPGRTPFAWEPRVKVALGTAKGIAHIHSIGGPSFTLGNIKSSNILIDQDMEARITDIGLIPIMNIPLIPSSHSSGYQAPEVLETKVHTHKSDIYSFGILLLDILTGKKPFFQSLSGGEMVDLLVWVQKVVKSGHVFDVELMRSHTHETEMIKMLQIALTCVVKVPDKRPSITEIVGRIEDIGSLSD
ncbi:probable inactive receptor kinase [Tanacetum coccineum]